LGYEGVGICYIYSMCGVTGLAAATVARQELGHQRHGLHQHHQEQEQQEEHVQRGGACSSSSSSIGCKTAAWASITELDLTSAAAAGGPPHLLTGLAAAVAVAAATDARQQLGHQLLSLT
jgi:hypothetical protein